MESQSELPEIIESTRLDSWCLTTIHNLMHDTLIRFICQLGIYKNCYLLLPVTLSPPVHFCLTMETVIYTTFLNEGYTETGIVLVMNRLEELVVSTNT
jgi:hypothetical protein